MTRCHAQRLRCVVCGNPDWHERGTEEECTHCGLVVEGPDALTRAARDIPERLSRGVATHPAGGGWSLSPAAWRNAAWRFGYVLSGDGARRADAKPGDVTLGIMCRADDLPAVNAMLAELDGHFSRTIVAIDGGSGEAGTEGRAMVIRAPLAGDYAAQRNRIQAAAGDGWVLQLDSDERPTPALLASLGWLTAAADADGLRSLGLPRSNLVDGRASALWPDIQYRLNRADVRYAGRVHERPDVPFAQTSLALPAVIEHRLTGDRVRARTRLYGAMAAGAARPEDEARLLRGFDAIADR